MSTFKTRSGYYPKAKGRLYFAGEFLFDWQGGHTVNVRLRGGRGSANPDIDCFSVGDFALDQATTAEVEGGIKAWLANR